MVDPLPAQPASRRLCPGASRLLARSSDTRPVWNSWGGLDWLDTGDREVYGIEIGRRKLESWSFTWSK